MDWIHCNSCFLKPGNGISHVLTSCGHIFCTKCCNLDTREKTCNVCNKTFTCITLAPDKMSSEVKCYFTDPENLASKLTEIIRFQKTHRRLLFSKYFDMEKKCEQAIENIDKLKKAVQQGNEESKKLMNENSKLKHLLKEVNNYFTSTEFDGDKIEPHSTRKFSKKLNSNFEIPHYKYCHMESAISKSNREKCLLNSVFGTSSSKEPSMFCKKSKVE